MGGRPVSASTWTFKQYPLLKALDAIHLLGLTDVELWAEGVHLDPRGDLPDVEEVAAALDRLGLWPTGMHAPFKGLDLTVKDETARRQHVDVLRQALDVSASLDCISVVVHVDGAGDGPVQGTRSERLERAAGALSELCGYALALGITLLVENQPDPSGERIGSRADELVHLVEAVDMPNLGLCFDLAHAEVSTGSWEAEWQIAAEHVASVHLSDTRGDRDDHLPLGEGVVDWRRWLSTWDEFGGDLGVVLEVAGGEDAVRQSMAAREVGSVTEAVNDAHRGGVGPEERRVVLACSDCGVDQPHRVRYRHDVMEEMRCMGCGRTIVLSLGREKTDPSPSGRSQKMAPRRAGRRVPRTVRRLGGAAFDLSVRAVTRAATKPGRLWRQVRDEGPGVLKSMPVRAATKPWRLARELQRDVGRKVREWL